MTTLLVLCSFTVLSAVVLASDEFESWILHMSRQRRCYEDLGCFDLESPWFSWSRPIPVLPQHPEIIDTKFYLMTRNNIDEPELLRTRPVLNLSGSSFRRGLPVFYIVHGYISHYTDDWITSVAIELLKMVFRITFCGGKGGLQPIKERIQSQSTYSGVCCNLGTWPVDCNVVLVDWANGSNIINYVQAVANTRIVAAELARLTKGLSDIGFAQPRNIHGIGFSLGAQILGYMSNNTTSLQRITALDPAQPGFEGNKPIVRLDANDAHFVDVIHTNGVPFLPELGLGMYSSAGHVDFYVNGGEAQPGCRRGNGKAGTMHHNKKDIYQRIHRYLENYANLDVRIDSIEELEQFIEVETEDSFYEADPQMTTFSILDFLIGSVSSLIDYVNCSHTRAPKYFLETLKEKNCSFWGVSWNLIEDAPDVSSCSLANCSQMGIHSILYPARGNFYVPINSSKPFCQRHPQIEVVMKNSLIDELLFKTSSDCQK